MTEPSSSQEKLPLVPMIGSLVLAIACGLLFWWLFIRQVPPERSTATPGKPVLPLVIVSYPEDETLLGPEWSDPELGISFRPPAGVPPASNDEVARLTASDSDEKVTLGIWKNDEAGITITLNLFTPPPESRGARWIASGYLHSHLEGIKELPEAEQAVRREYASEARMLVGGKHVMYRVNMLLGPVQAASILGDMSGGKIIQLAYGVEGEFTEEIADQLAASLGTLRFPAPPASGAEG